jgi:hypothetical protein
MTERPLEGYGFEVFAPGDEHSGDYWTVQLPHSCDEWVIAVDKDPGVAIARLESFIVEAQKALSELRSRAAIPGTCPDVMCVLTFGHSGSHRNKQGGSWEFTVYD